MWGSLHDVSPPPLLPLVWKMWRGMGVCKFLPCWHIWIPFNGALVTFLCSWIYEDLDLPGLMPCVEEVVACLVDATNCCHFILGRTFFDCQDMDALIYNVHPQIHKLGYKGRQCMWHVIFYTTHSSMLRVTAFRGGLSSRYHCYRIATTIFHCTIFCI